jgi:hypothetical protein
MSGELPYIMIEDLTILFCYKNVESTQRAMSRGTFPVPTYRVGRRRVADREVVRAYFRNMRDEGLKEVSN